MTFWRRFALNEEQRNRAVTKRKVGSRERTESSVLFVLMEWRGKRGHAMMGVGRPVSRQLSRV
jgi:hypothetical protein